AGYAYIAARLTSTAPLRVALAAPFIMVWILPVVYWFGDRDRRGRVHEWVQALSFLCMGWLSFLLVLTVGRDVLLLATAALPPLAAGAPRRAARGAGVRGPRVLRARQPRLLLGGGAVDGALRGDGISRAPQRPRHHRAWRGTPPDRRRHRFRRANVRSRRAATSGPRDRRRRAAGLPSAPGAQSEDRVAGRAGRLRPATFGSH